MHRYRVSRRDATPAPRPGAHSVPRCVTLLRARLGTPNPPIPPCPALPTAPGRLPPAACSPGPRRLPAAGSEVASSPRPRRQRWSLVLAASALDAGARLRCKEENATEGFKVKKERAGAGPARPRPAPPLPSPSPLLLLRPAPGWGSGCRAGGAVRGLGRAGGWCVTCPAVVPPPLRRRPPLPRSIAPPGGHRGAPGRRRGAVVPSGGVFGTPGSLRWVRGLGCNTRRAAAVLGQRGGGCGGLLIIIFLVSWGGSGLFQ